MLNSKWIKIGGIVLSVAGSVIGLASDYIGRKSVMQDVIQSEEIQKMIAKEVAKALHK